MKTLTGADIDKAVTANAMWWKLKSEASGPTLLASEVQVHASDGSQAQIAVQASLDPVLLLLPARDELPFDPLSGSVKANFRTVAIGGSKTMSIPVSNPTDYPVEIQLVRRLLNFFFKKKLIFFP